jgi:tryptophan-rich sensory protein
VATLITFFVGSLANIYINQDGWYESLNKSVLNPPGYVFGIVWPILYMLMALVSYFNHKEISKLFLTQLLLNAIWSWIFFYFQMPIIAFIDILFLVLINLVIQIRLFKTSKLYALLYFPYPCWLFFAAFLNLNIVILN